MTDRILRLTGVKDKTGLSCTHIYDMISKGLFPQSIPLGARAVGWLESEVDQWISDKVKAAQKARQTKAA